MKTLKYFALASKISVGAEDKSQNLLTVSDRSECLIPGIYMAADNTVFIFVCFIFFMFAMWVREEFQLDHIDATTKLFSSFEFFFIKFAVTAKFSPEQILGKQIAS